MRILLLDQFGDLGGGQLVLLDLLPALLEQGWRAHVACPEGPLQERARTAGADVSTLDCGQYSMGRKSIVDMIRFAAALPRMSRTIAERVQTLRADLVYVNGPRVLPASASVRAPVLFHCHNRISGRATIALAGRALRRSRAAVVSVSRFSVEPLASHIGADRLQIVPNASRPAPAAAAGHQGLRIGVVGRLDANKGQQVFVNAARLLSGPRYVVCGAPLFGDPKANAYAQQVRKSAAGLNIEFTGRVEDAMNVMQTLDLLVVPSLVSEAMPRVIPEAFACGVPVMAFRTGGIPEVILDGVNGWLVEERTPAALAAAMGEAIRDPAALRRAGDAAQACWRERFQLDEWRRRMIAALLSAAEPARRGQ